SGRGRPSRGARHGRAPRPRAPGIPAPRGWPPPGQRHRQLPAAFSASPSVEAGGHWRPDRLPEGGSVEAAQPVPRVGSATQGAHEPPIARVAHPREEIAVGDGGALQASEAALPEAVVVEAGEEGPRREVAGKKRV